MKHTVGPEAVVSVPLAELLKVSLVSSGHDVSISTRISPVFGKWAQIHITRPIQKSLVLRQWSRSLELGILKRPAPPPIPDPRILACRQWMIQFVGQKD